MASIGRSPQILQEIDGFASVLLPYLANISHAGAIAAPGAKKFVKLLHFFIALGRFSDKFHFNDTSAHFYLLMTYQTKTPKNPLNSSVSTLFALNFYLPVQLAHYSASWPDTFKNQPTKTRI